MNIIDISDKIVAPGRIQKELSLLQADIVYNVSELFCLPGEIATNVIHKTKLYWFPEYIDDSSAVALPAELRQMLLVPQEWTNMIYSCCYNGVYHYIIVIGHRGELAAGMYFVGAASGQPLPKVATATLDHWLPQCIAQQAFLDLARTTSMLVLLVPQGQELSIFSEVFHNNLYPATTKRFFDTLYVNDVVYMPFEDSKYYFDIFRETKNKKSFRYVHWLDNLIFEVVDNGVLFHRGNYELSLAMFAEIKSSS